MGVSLQQYRACIGTFNSIKFLYSDLFLSWCFSLNFPNPSKLLAFRFKLFWVQYFYIFLRLCLLLLAGDIESNPGPRERENTLSICHWNLNSVWVDNFLKIAQISAFLSVHKFDIFCIGESYLDLSIDDKDNRLKIDNYEILRCDHPSNSKKGGVYLYYRDNLSIVEKPELTTLDECLVCEVRSRAKKLILSSLSFPQSEYR